MENEWKIAYDRERSARLAAEKMLDEKTREVQSAMEVMRYQNMNLQSKNIEAQLLMSLANEMQMPLTFKEALALYTSSVALVLPCIYATAFLHDRNDNARWISAHALFERVPMPPHFSTALDQFNQPALPHQQIACERGELHIFDVDAHSPDYAHYREAGICAIITVPIKRHGIIAALAEFGFVDKNLIRQEYLQMTQAAAYQVGVIIERREQEKKLNENFQTLQKTHEELKQAQRQLLQSEKMASLGQLSAGVAHEINNPIGFVISNIGSLKEYIQVLTQLSRMVENLLPHVTESNPVYPMVQDIRSHWQKHDTDFILSDLEGLLRDSEGGLLRVRDIVANLKEFARADQNKREATDLVSLVENTIKIVWNEIKYKADLEKELESVPPIYCNAGQISQVLVNLLVNAAQAIESHGQITVRLKQEHSQVAIEVSDTGKGMNPSVMQRIFEPFFTTKPVGVGTGLGLSIAYGIMQAHQGAIEVSSVEGKGTTFRLVLPRRTNLEEAA